MSKPIRLLFKQCPSSILFQPSMDRADFKWLLFRARCMDFEVGFGQ